MLDDQRDALRELLRRVDEVRGLSDRPGGPATLALDDPDTLVRTLGEMAEELERSHRRLIETNIQLVSLREVAGRLTGAADAAETARTVTRYLGAAFGFDHVALLLVDRERGTLSGVWSAEGEATPLELPLVGERGALARAVWQGRSLRHLDCERHPAAHLPESHPLSPALSGLGSLLCVPLQRSAAAGAEGACADCPMGTGGPLAPTPSQAADAWLAACEDAERRCLACGHHPALGVIAAGRRRGQPQLAAADLTLLESIALTIAPMVENARLFQELRKSQRFQRHVIDGMVSALLAVNTAGDLLGFNRAAEELLGWQAGEVLGRGVGELFGQDLEAIIAGTIGSGTEAVRQETFLRARDGGALPVRLTASPLRDEAGSVYGAVATFLDLTPIRRAEEHARQNDRLAALGRFTSSVAHEIRNPLTGIGMGVQRLARLVADHPNEQKNLAFVQDEIRRLDRIVQQLFDVTHPRRLELRVQPLADTLERSARSLEGLSVDRDVPVAFAIAPGLPDLPHDADQIQQVFINLIKNAIEVSPRGGRVDVHASLAPAARTRGTAPGVVVTVSDTGPGIDAETCRQLFEPFFTTKPGGTGLGLYITHAIVKRHGGNLTVTSEPGQGATFRVELPLDPEGGNT